MRALVGEPTTWVPGPGLPDGVAVDRSNNNLDLCHHDGELVLAFRTAPTHFASRRARLVVVRGEPGRWRLERTVAMGRDVREPRLVDWQGRLLLYWFDAGRHPLRFEPGRIWVSERLAEGRWTPPRCCSGPDHVVWRVRPAGGRLLLSCYRGAGTLFTSAPEPLSVELWESADGYGWSPVDFAEPTVHSGGAEADFVELVDGSLAVVVRKEGPDGGWGGDVGWAPEGEPGRWLVRPDPGGRKPDSPFLFTELVGGAERVLLACRRQVANGGRYDLGSTRGSPLARTRRYQLTYSLTPKRTALYLVEPRSGTLAWLADLPSAGDTAFVGGVRVAPGRWLLANYTSDPRHARRPWLVGQLGRTRIDAVEVDLLPA